MFLCGAWELQFLICCIGKSRTFLWSTSVRGWLRTQDNVSQTYELIFALLLSVVYVLGKKYIKFGVVEISEATKNLFAKPVQNISSSIVEPM